MFGKARNCFRCLGSRSDIEVAMAKRTQIRITSLPPPTPDPADLAKNLIRNFRTQKPNELIVLNLATINEEEGVLGRTMVFIDFSDDGGIIVGTDRNSRKYRDVMRNPNVAVTFLFVVNVAGVNVHQQIRINGLAQECIQSRIDALWEKQPIFDQIRSVLHSQKPASLEEIRDKYQEMVDKCEGGQLTIPVPDNTTYLEIKPTKFDFYQSAANNIADCIIYTKQGDKWAVQQTFG